MLQAVSRLIRLRLVLITWITDGVASFPFGILNDYEERVVRKWFTKELSGHPACKFTRNLLQFIVLLILYR